MAMAAVKYGYGWAATGVIGGGGGGGHIMVVVPGKDTAIKDVSKMAGRRRILRSY
jgi:CubicO group peptidase (beta-lactamase class C family)